MIQRMSDEHKINFLESVNIEQSPLKKEEIPIKLISEQRSKKLLNKDDGYKTSHHISSASTGAIKNDKNSSQIIGLKNSNNIWNDNDLFNTKEDSKEKVQKQKEEILSNKRVAEQKRMQELADNLKQTQSGQISSISLNGHYQGSKYYSPTNNMSIFDTKDFERIVEKTEGEKITEENRNKRSQKDESWKNSGKQLSSKDITEKMIKNIFSKDR